jgi:hypothetical protein
MQWLGSAFLEDFFYQRRACFFPNVHQNNHFFLSEDHTVRVFGILILYVSTTW